MQIESLTALRVGKTDIDLISALPLLAKKEQVRQVESMNRETALFLDHVEDYLKSVTREITKARQFEDGTTDHARHISEARFKLQEALTVIGRALPTE